MSAGEVGFGFWDEGDYRLEHLRAQELSGLSVAGYCRRHDVRPATFYGWRRLDRGRGARGAADGAAGFTEVFAVGASRIADGTPLLGSAWAVEVALPSGAVVRVGAGADARLLRAVFEALA